MGERGGKHLGKLQKTVSRLNLLHLSSDLRDIFLLSALREEKLCLKRSVSSAGISALSDRREAAQRVTDSVQVQAISSSHLRRYASLHSTIIPQLTRKSSVSL